MFTVTENIEGRYEVKKSVFLSFLVPYVKFEETLQALKKEHPKATHIVWAYRTLNEYDQIVENSTDDGEPKGCAGAPTLTVLRGQDVVNAAVLTVRYFGGIKLGKGGMVRGYSSSAKEVLLNAPLSLYEKKDLVLIKTPYSLVKRYEYFLHSIQVDFPDREFGEKVVVWRLTLTEKELQKVNDFEENTLGLIKL